MNTNDMTYYLILELSINIIYILLMKLKINN